MFGKRDKRHKELLENIHQDNFRIKILDSWYRMAVKKLLDVKEDDEIYFPEEWIHFKECYNIRLYGEVNEIAKDMEHDLERLAQMLGYELQHGSYVQKGILK